MEPLVSLSAALKTQSFVLHFVPLTKARQGAIFGTHSPPPHVHRPPPTATLHNEARGDPAVPAEIRGRAGSSPQFKTPKTAHLWSSPRTSRSLTGASRFALFYVTVLENMVQLLRQAAPPSCTPPKVPFLRSSGREPATRSAMASRLVPLCTSHSRLLLVAKEASDVGLGNLADGALPSGR